MDLEPYFRSVVEQDPMAVVLCNLRHEILYMNPAAVRRYEKRGGADLVGRNLLDCHAELSAQKIRSVVAWFSGHPAHNRIFTFHNARENLEVYMVALRDRSGALIGYYEKHESRTPEQVSPFAQKA